MRIIFDKALQDARERILEASDEQLASHNFSSTLINGLEIDVPELIEAGAQQNVSEEIMTFENAPPNVQFTPGRPMEYAEISVPIKGSSNVLSFLSKQILWNPSFTIRNGHVIYREHSSRKIIGNVEVIEAIKKNAKTRIDGVKSVFNQYKKESDNFINEELMPFVEKHVADERKKREDKKNSENSLNPFD